MAADEIEESVASIREEVIAMSVQSHIPPGSLEEQWDTEGLSKQLEADFGLHLDIDGWIRDDKTLNEDGILERCIEESDKAYKEKESTIGSELMRNVEKQDDVAATRSALERAPRGHGPSAAGNWSALVRTKESQAGIQARGVRDVWRDARAGQARHDQHPDADSRFRASRIWMIQPSVVGPPKQ